MYMYSCTCKIVHLPSEAEHSNLRFQIRSLDPDVNFTMYMQDNEDNDDDDDDDDDFGNDDDDDDDDDDDGE